jgi:oligopeptide transport system substrate-binding protein
MFERFIRMKLILLVLVAMAIPLVAIACGSDDEPVAAPAPAPTPVPAPTPDLEKIITDAVSRVPQGATAAEIQKLVSDSVSAALAAQPGLSRSDVESIVNSATAGQLSAEDVRKIVDDSVRALPVPETLDLADVSRLVQSALPQLPESVSADEISRIVQAQVTAGLEGSLTRGDVEDLVATAVEGAVTGAVGDQLSADNVKAIVESSLVATNTAIEEAAMAAADAARAAEGAAMAADGAAMAASDAATAAEEAIQGVQKLSQIIPTPEPDTGIVRVPAALPPPAFRGATVSDQTLVFPIQSKRSRTAPNVEGSYILRTVDKWVYMPLFQFDPEGNLRQGVADSYMVSDDGLTYTVFIKDEAVFNNGSPVTASHVKAAWEYGVFPENQISWGGSLNNLIKVVGIDAVASGDATEAAGLVAVDDKTLEINLTVPNPTWPLEMGLWLLGIYDADHAKANPDKKWQENPIGVGPYKLQWDPESGLIEVTPSDYWWGDPPVIQKITMPWVGDLQTQMIMYENGEADVIFGDLVRQPSAHNPDHKFHGDLQKVKGSGIWYFAFDSAEPPFDDINVRKALSHAVDMETAVHAVFAPTATWGTGFIHPSLASHTPRDGYVYDVAKAKEYAAQSKYGADPAQWPKMHVALSRPQYVRLGEIFQEQWKENLGANVTITKLERGQQAPEDVNLYRLSSGGRVADAGGNLERLGHSESVSVTRANGTHHSDPTLDALIEEALQLPIGDPEKIAKYQEAEKIMIDNYWILPIIFSTDRGYLVQPWIKNFVTTFGDDWNNLPWMAIAERKR